MVATALTCASETFMTLQFSDWLSQMSNTNPGVIIYRHCITNELLKVATGAEEGTSAQRSCAQRKVLEVLRVYCQIHYKVYIYIRFLILYNSFDSS